MSNLYHKVVALLDPIGHWPVGTQGLVIYCDNGHVIVEIRAGEKLLDILHLERAQVRTVVPALVAIID